MISLIYYNNKLEQILRDLTITKFDKKSNLFKSEIKQKINSSPWLWGLKKYYYLLDLTPNDLTIPIIVHHSRKQEFENWYNKYCKIIQEVKEFSKEIERLNKIDNSLKELLKDIIVTINHYKLLNKL